MRLVQLARGEQLTDKDLKRCGALAPEVVAFAQDIVNTVCEGGDKAVRDYCLKFDGVCPKQFRVPDEVVQDAPNKVDPKFLAAIKKAYKQIRDFHEREREDSWFTTTDDGTILGVKMVPLATVAVYVPGGRAQYPSTVLMDVIPAKVAGVKRVTMLTPPQKDGTISSYTLAAAAIAGVDEVYAVGGAQAIAAVAYGTESIPKVDKIVGPGNAFVAAAKRSVSGDVGIDMVAGPSEVCVLADGAADPTVIAADLMAQAEHDPMATCYLVTDSAELADSVNAELEKLLVQSPREEITRKSLDHGVAVCTTDMDAAIDVVNVVAPEHLELHLPEAFSILGKIHNAGAIFVGPWSSEPLGDYVAGPNHTLPTGGTALFSNPLGVYDFQKRSSIISYTPEGLMKDAEATQTMAQAEGLWAHALSVGMRVKLIEKDEDHFKAGDDPTADALHTAWPEELQEPKKSFLNGGQE